MQRERGSGRGVATAKVGLTADCGCTSLLLLLVFLLLLLLKLPLLALALALALALSLAHVLVCCIAGGGAIRTQLGINIGTQHPVVGRCCCEAESQSRLDDGVLSLPVCLCAWLHRPEP